MGLLCVMGLTVTGCGTVVNGNHQDLAITSYPGGATVSVDGVQRGSTPVVVPVSRKHAHVVAVTHDGYHPYEASVVPMVSTWVWGNWMYLGVFGVAVDAWTGGLWDLSQDKVHAQLASHPTATVKTAQEMAAK